MLFYSRQWRYFYSILDMTKEGCCRWLIAGQIPTNHNSSSLTLRSPISTINTLYSEGVLFYINYHFVFVTYAWTIQSHRWVWSARCDGEGSCGEKEQAVSRHSAWASHHPCQSPRHLARDSRSSTHITYPLDWEFDMILNQMNWICYVKRSSEKVSF